MVIAPRDTRTRMLEQYDPADGSESNRMQSSMLLMPPSMQNTDEKQHQMRRSGYATIAGQGVAQVSSKKQPTLQEQHPLLNFEPETYDPQ